MDDLAGRLFASARDRYEAALRSNGAEPAEGPDAEDPFRLEAAAGGRDTAVQASVPAPAELRPVSSGAAPTVASK